jgi:hypothetical protein
MQQHKCSSTNAAAQMQQHECSSTNAAAQMQQHKCSSTNTALSDVVPHHQAATAEGSPQHFLLPMNSSSLSASSP